MNIQSVILSPETPELEFAVEHLAEVAFGPGRFARAAFRLRENRESRPELSFVARLDGELVGAVKLTDILIGKRASLLLGPLVVTPKCKNHGVGHMLMNKAVDEARAAGHESILLVGDEPYYGRFGFEKVPFGSVTMPGPVDPNRLLICYLQDTSESAQGNVTSF